MKVAFIIHNVAETESIDEIIEKCEIKNFTRIQKAIGKNESADPVFDNEIWPGYYSITIIENPGDKIGILRTEIKYLKEHLKIPDLKYYEFDADIFI